MDIALLRYGFGLLAFIVQVIIDAPGPGKLRPASIPDAVGILRHNAAPLSHTQPAAGRTAAAFLCWKTVYHTPGGKVVQPRRSDVLRVWRTPNRPAGVRCPASLPSP